MHQGLIRKGNQIWIADSSALKTKIIVAMHNSAVGEHFEDLLLTKELKGDFGGRE